MACDKHWPGNTFWEGNRRGQIHFGLPEREVEYIVGGQPGMTNTIEGARGEVKYILRGQRGRSNTLGVPEREVKYILGGQQGRSNTFWGATGGGQIHFGKATGEVKYNRGCANSQMDSVAAQ